MIFSRAAAILGLVVVAIGLPIVSGHTAPPEAAPFLTNSLSMLALDDSPLQYHGGPVLLGNISIYNVFYGNWNKHSNAVHRIVTFTNVISDSSWFNTLKHYGDKSGRRISGPVRVAGNKFDRYSQGQHLDFERTANILRHNIGHGKDMLPAKQYKAIYNIWVSKDVVMTDECVPGTCAYHYYANVSNTLVTYTVLQDPSASGCIKNGCNFIKPPKKHSTVNVAVEAMLGYWAHELADTLTDPFINSWVTLPGTEIGSKCIGQYGKIRHRSDGTPYNMKLHGHRYLVPQIWSHWENRCESGAK